MNTETQAQLGAHGITLAIANKKSEIVALLNRNGVTLPEQASLLDIAIKTVGLLRTSKTFRGEFLQLFNREDVQKECHAAFSGMNGQYSNAFGDSPFTFGDPAFTIPNNPSGSAFNQTGTAPATGTQASATSGGFFSASNITNLFNTGINALLTLDTNKTNRLLGNSASNVAMYQAQANQNGTAYPYTQGQKDNTVLYVVLGICGVAIAGTIVYMVSKKS